VTEIAVLIVEDEAPKLGHIESYVRSILPGLNIRIARSVNSALDELDSSNFDLILLDMSLPTFDIGERESGGRPQGFGGIEILRYMKMSGIECPAIVITGYEAFLKESGTNVDLSEIRAELILEFPSLLRGVLHYNSSVDEWKDALQKVLEDFDK